MLWECPVYDIPFMAELMEVGLVEYSIILREWALF